MAEGKKGFILYTDLKSTVEKLLLKDKEKNTNNAGELFLHILRYVSDENPEPINDTIDIVFEPIKMQLKRDLEKWEKRAERSRSNGLNGGRPPKNDNPKEPKITQETQQVILKPKQPDNDNVIMCNNVLSDNDNVNVILLEKETKSNICEISDFEVLEYEVIKTEKSSLKKEKRFNFKQSLIDYGFDENLVDEWLQVRKAKKAVNTETSFNSFIREIESRPCDINSMLRIAVERSWSGFKYQWVDNLNNNNNGNGKQQNRTQKQVFIDTANSDSARNFKM